MNSVLAIVRTAELLRAYILATKDSYRYFDNHSNEIEDILKDAEALYTKVIEFTESEEGHKLR